MSNWREALDALDIATTTAAGPAGADGDWHQLVASFGTKGFLRALTDGEVLALESAPPGDASAARDALSRAGWDIAGDGVPFVATRGFPVETDDLRSSWLVITKLADATRTEDASGFTAALAVEEPTSAPDAQPDSPGGQTGEPVAVAPAAGSAFESIGDAERPAMNSAFAFSLNVVDGVVEVALGFNEVLESRAYEDLERRLVGNLRGKYDVVVDVVGPHEIAARLDVEPQTRVALRVRPDKAVAGFSVRDAEQAVGGYFETLANLAASGIDPLVFLGARASKRDTGAFEAIGAKMAAASDAVQTPHSLLVEDEDGDDAQIAEEEDAVVFGEVSQLDADAPLETGRFDDHRLKRSDATTALVDVVLRHPGYSDRNIGQVMSILLSIDYASCLDIAARAPAVVAWGVARDRALTMKTVIEGAGGKVVLVEPGSFGQD